MGRPTIVEVGTGYVRIDTHDAYYLNQLRRLKQAVLDTHPDRRHFTRVVMSNGANVGKDWVSGHIRPSRGGHKVNNPTTTKPFRFARLQLSKFITTEVQWYAQYGLTPPNIKRVKHECIDRGYTLLLQEADHG